MVKKHVWLKGCSYFTNIFAGFCICEVPVPADYYGWFWLAELSLLRDSRVQFYYDISVPCHPFSVRFTSSANLVSSTTSGTRTVPSVEFAPLPVPHLACVAFFSSLPFVEMVPVTPIVSATKFKVRRTLPLVRPP